MVGAVVMRGAAERRMFCSAIVFEVLLSVVVVFRGGWGVVLPVIGGRELMEIE